MDTTTSCKFPRCFHPATLKACLICKDISHKECINYFTNKKLKECEDLSLSICGVKCFYNFIKGEINECEDGLKKISLKALLDKIEFDSDVGVEVEGEVETENGDVKSKLGNRNMRIKTYTTKQKQDLILQKLSSKCNNEEVGLQYGVPTQTVKSWCSKTKRDTIMAEDPHSSRKRKTGGGRKEIIYFSQDFLTFFKDLIRYKRNPSIPIMLLFIQIYYKEFFVLYLEVQGRKLDSLKSLVREFGLNHNFRIKEDNALMLSEKDQQNTQQLHDSFINKFKTEYPQFYNNPSSLINIDETTILLDDIPSSILLEKKGCAKLESLDQFGNRITVILGIRGDGTKLPILYVLKGDVEEDNNNANITTETPKHGALTDGNHFIYQSNGCVDEIVWKHYLENVLKPQLSIPSAIILDDLQYHNSEDTKLFLKETNSNLILLPKNSTSYLQPLDLFIMGNLKRQVISFWIKDEVDTSSVYFNLTTSQRVSEAVRVCSKAFVDVPKYVVMNSFVKTKFVVEG